ncbi:leucine-rich repeat domain-containing protein [Roseiconus lacunae]|uniref:Leucine Rich repeats (2 copies) n=1 Tax=Roseiconus lacunae TaxID=2605694 RepID=A0ABT7PM67_9BACT|nr:hypothetical protein [Roseiconus lacunae]MDM4017575.1 hypothetical protein [Roseiconus lacunae]
MVLVILGGGHFASANDRTFAYAIAPTVQLPSHFEDQCDRVCRSDPGQGIPKWDVPGWEQYMQVWSELAADPTNQSLRQFLGLPIGDDTGQSLAAIRATRGRSAPSWIGWKPGTYAQVDTPHFQIFSRSDRDKTTEVAEDLERCYWVWTQIFFPLWEGRAQATLHLRDDSSAGTMSDRLAGGRARLSTRKKMRVVLLRDADDYGRTLARLTGGSLQAVSQSTGFYSSERRTSFFFPDQSGDAIASRRHELVHQLFREATRSQLGGDEAGARSDFWLVEGIAGYFESMHFDNGFATVGGWDSPRLQFARYRVFAQQQVVPLAALRPDGQTQVQQRGDLAQFYAFAIAYTHWMMDSGDVATRRWIYQMLADLYRIKIDVETLNEPTDPERGMVAMLRLDDATLASNPAGRTLEQLCLRGCLVSSKGLSQLEPAERLRWLDLTGLPINGDDLRRLVKSPESLTQLSLEACPMIDDAIASWLRSAKQLEELDLSGTRCGDLVLQSLAETTSLQTLWLTDTQVTDKSLEILSRLPQLETIDLRGTAVSAEQIARLQRQHPNWKLNP